MNDAPELTLRLIQQLKSCGKRRKTADSTGVELSGIDLLVRTLALRSYLLREVLEPGEKNVGIFLPPTVPAVATNFAVALADRVAVNLNYTSSSAVLKQCCEAAKLKHVITSRKFIDKVNLDVGCPMIFLEDVKEKITLGDKLFALANAKLRSAAGLHKSLGLAHKTNDDPLTIIFTSGSTGFPKGVVLSSGNITANIEGIRDVIHLDEHDVVMGILPFFHSFGYTVTLWTAMVLPCSGVFHFSPLEARPIGNLAEKYKATVLLATPTFLRNYLRRVEAHQFKSLEVVVVGAEKMPLPLLDEFEDKFGVRPVEGYGTTELSPVVCVNIPTCRSSAESDAENTGLLEGSVGKPFKGSKARTVSVDTDEPLPAGEVGLIEVCGSNVMQGYLDAPDQTAKVMHDEWYRTGDVGIVDQQGFIHITGRLSRFSKIGGEMVPHIQIEEHLSEVVGTGEEGEPLIAVTAVPDERRGERLIILHTAIELTSEELLAELRARDLPKLYIPSADSFFHVAQIPLLGSGKLDLKALKDLAAEKAASSV